MTQTSAANRKEVKAAEKAARQQSVMRGEVLKRTMATYEGRMWIWAQLEDANVFTSIYNDSPHHMAFLEGCRNGGLKLLADVMEFAPDQFILSMREAHGRRIDERSRAEQSGSKDRDGGNQGRDPDQPRVRIVPNPDAPGGYETFGLVGDGGEGRDEADGGEG